MRAMYQDHFKFNKEPFSIAPDPDFLFLSEGHNEALAHLMYGFSHGGFVLVTGEVGTGKTTLLRNLLNRTPRNLDVAFILNPRLTVKELLETICEELGVALEGRKPDSVKQYIDLLNRHLLETHRAGRSTVVIIDEAQNLSPAVLEQIRLLTNLETNERKLLRIILIGQPELGEMLARKELRQLAQRITARYHLNPLSKGDVGDYVAHRVAKAGGNPDIFSRGAIAALYRVSRGTPRLINVVADRALLGAYVAGSYHVSANLVRGAAREVFGEAWALGGQYLIGAAAIVVVVGLVMAWAYFSERGLPDTPALTSEPAVSRPAGGDAAGAIPAAPATAPATVPAAAEPPTPPLQPLAAQSAPGPRTAANEAPSAARQAAPAPAPLNVRRPSGSTYRIQRQAFSRLFALWGADYPIDSNAIPCDFAPTVGLQCLRRNGGWSELDGLNTPVVLELWDDQAAPYYATLARKLGGRYELIIGSGKGSVAPRDLRDAWFGAYILLWQTPPDYNGSLRQGDTHSNVRWLRDKLTKLDPSLQLGDTSNYFGPDLRDAVIDFQRGEGLLADGIVGPLTYIRLIDRLGAPGPKLSS